MLINFTIATDENTKKLKFLQWMNAFSECTRIQIPTWTFWLKFLVFSSASPEDYWNCLKIESILLFPHSKSIWCILSISTKFKRVRCQNFCLSLGNPTTFWVRWAAEVPLPFCRWEKRICLKEIRLLSPHVCRFPPSRLILFPLSTETNGV
jgi:hypothetical protein